MSQAQPEPINLGSELLIYQVAKVKAEIERCMTVQPTAVAQVRLDCVGLNEIDAAGLQLLLVTARHLQLNGGRLQLVRVNQVMHRQLQRWNALKEIDAQCVD